MTKEGMPCVVCGSQADNFDVNFCSLQCYEKWKANPKDYDEVEE